MMCRQKECRIGEHVTVRQVWGGYPLPAGLPEGASVKLLSFDHGYYQVDYQGRSFQIFLANVNSGMEYLVNDKRWLDENHPLVLAVERAERKRLSQTDRRSATGNASV